MSDLLTIKRSTCQSIAEAIRERTGSKEKIHGCDFDDKIRAIPDSTKAMLENAIEHITGNAEKVSAHKLRDNKALKSVNLPEATIIEDYAFYSCSGLEQVSVPKTTKILNYAFTECGALESIEAPLVDEVGTQAFSGCAALTSINFPELKIIGNYAFSDTGLTDVYVFPKATYIGSSGFAGSAITGVSAELVENLQGATFKDCTALEAADFPNVTIFSGTSVFSGCSALKFVNFPALTELKANAFEYCSALEYIEFNNLNSIQSGCFSKCTSLQAMVLRRTDTITAIKSANSLGALDNGVQGYVYVPQALKATYESDTFWGYTGARFRALEDYTVDGTVTGALDMTKI